MIGRRITGEQAERCAFEDRGHLADKAVGITMIVVFAGYLLVNILEVVV